MSSNKVVQQDWTTGRSSELVERKKMNMAADETEHAEHTGHQHMMDKNGMPKINMPLFDYSALSRIIASVQPLNLAAPVLILPPSKKSPEWTASSKAQSRPLRADLVLDAMTVEIKSRKTLQIDHCLIELLDTGLLFMKVSFLVG